MKLSLKATGIAAGAVLAGCAAAAWAGAAEESNRYVRDGVALEFSVKDHDGEKIMEGHTVEVRFRLSDAKSGDPVKGALPAAWLDVADNIQGGPGAQQKSCVDKIALYLRGVVGMRPMVDMNSYYVLVMNRDPSISVIDPVVSMAGRTSTLASIVLRRSPADWARSADEKRLYVTMPDAHQVAVVDTERFAVAASVPAGRAPTRVALQPDGNYVWVGNNSFRDTESGVTVLDASTYRQAAFFATGKGHHEIAFTEDSRYAFVTNRDSGTVSVIDVRDLKKVKDIATGPKPISLGYSELSKTLYVADGKTGTVSAIDARSHELARALPAKAGLGPLRVSQDGRWVMVVNTANDKVYVIDASTNAIAHEIEVGSQPFQLSFSRAFAYVRGLGTERVTMINLSSLGAGKKPIVQSFQAGSVAPREAGDLPLADSMAYARKEAAAFIVNPADNTTYFYMEGMNAPMSNYKVFGHTARAVTVVDRSLREVEPGVYSARLRVPASGTFDVGFTSTNPRITHCFSLAADENPMLQAGAQPEWRVEFVGAGPTVNAGATHPVRFRFIDPKTGTPRAGLKDVGVFAYRVPNFDRQRVFATEVSEGLYEARVPFGAPGAYYVFVESQSLKLDFTKGLFASVRAVPANAASLSEGAK